LLGNSPRDPSAIRRVREIASDYSCWHLCHSDPGVTQVSGKTARAATRTGQRTEDIAVPTLIVTSDHDYPACSEIADLLAGTVTGARKVVVRNAGHIINMEQPVRFNAVVLDFLAAVDAPVST
jgi:pimeloyl-ACP methyl ester carboxylesterase